MKYNYEIVVKIWRLRTIAQNISLLLGSILFSFFAIEIGYRAFDPFPFYKWDDITETQHGNLTVYDPILGWRGIPGGKAEIVTINSRVWANDLSPSPDQYQNSPLYQLLIYPMKLLMLDQHRVLQF